MSGQKYSCSPQLPQWSNWLGTVHLSLQHICQLRHRDHKSKSRECPRVPRWSGKHFKQKGPQFTSVFQMSRLGPHGSGVYHLSQVVKPNWGELRECGPTPHQQQPAVNLQHSLPDPEPKLTILKAPQKRWMTRGPSSFPYS